MNTPRPILTRPRKDEKRGAYRYKLREAQTREAEQEIAQYRRTPMRQGV